jgi:hypothetical protein
MKRKVLLIVGAIASLLVLTSAGIYAYNASTEKAACTS